MKWEGVECSYCKEIVVEATGIIYPPSQFYSLHQIHAQGKLLQSLEGRVLADTDDYILRYYPLTDM